MPRIRSIKPKFWDDNKLAKVSRDARLLFIGMWNFSDDLGVIISDPIWLKSKIFPFDVLEKNQLENWLNELCDKNFILRISHNYEGYFYIANFGKHQKINRANTDDIFIPNELLKNMLPEIMKNHESITDSSLTHHALIGEDRRGEDKDRIGVKSVNLKESGFSLIQLYDKTFEEVKKVPGWSRKITEQGFISWKEFVDFVYEKNYTELFHCKFVSPVDFQSLLKNEKFTKDKWDAVLKLILATGVKEEHNLFFRIPQFMGYAEKDKQKANNKQPQSSHTQVPSQDVYDAMQ